MLVFQHWKETFCFFSRSLILLVFPEMIPFTSGIQFWKPWTFWSVKLRKILPKVQEWTKQQFLSDANFCSTCLFVHKESNFWKQCQTFWAKFPNLSCSDQEKFLKKTKNVFKKLSECSSGDAKSRTKSRIDFAKNEIFFCSESGDVIKII